MQKATFLVLFLLSVPAFSAEHSVTCTDHWFGVAAVWKDGETKTTVEFSGDSGPDRSETPASVATLKNVVTLTFTDRVGGHLRIETNGEVFVKETKKSSESIVPACSVK